MLPTSSPPPAKGCFFIIGAQRSGTTYLYDLLMEHPDVAMAKPKSPEPKWFLDPRKIEAGPEEWKNRLFQGVSARWQGEKGTSYIEYPQSASAILNAFPEARFIAIFREPVARAVSNYRFSVENGLEKLSIERALTSEAEERTFDRAKISASPFHYLRRGRYADYLEAWTSHVPFHRIHLLVLEELLRDRSLDGLCSFLGLPTFKPKNMDKIVNAATEPMPKMSDSLGATLKEYFRESNRRLERILGRDLGIWRG